jgi:hypothetical protein
MVSVCLVSCTTPPSQNPESKKQFIQVSDVEDLASSARMLFLALTLPSFFMKSHTIQLGNGNSLSQKIVIKNIVEGQESK